MASVGCGLWGGSWREEGLLGGRVSACRGSNGSARGPSGNSAALDDVGNSCNFLPQFPSCCCRDELQRGWMGSDQRVVPAGLDKTSSQHHKSFPSIRPPTPPLPHHSFLPASPPFGLRKSPRGCFGSDEGRFGVMVAAGSGGAGGGFMEDRVTLRCRENEEESGEEEEKGKKKPLTSAVVFESGGEQSDLITGSNPYSHLTFDPPLPGERRRGKVSCLLRVRPGAVD